MEFLLCQLILYDSFFSFSWTLSLKNPFPLSMLLFPLVYFSKPSKNSYSTLSPPSPLLFDHFCFLIVWELVKTNKSLVSWKVLEEKIVFLFDHLVFLFFSFFSFIFLPFFSFFFFLSFYSSFLFSLFFSFFLLPLFSPSSFFFSFFFYYYYNFFFFLNPHTIQVFKIVERMSWKKASGSHGLLKPMDYSKLEQPHYFNKETRKKHYYCWKLILKPNQQ